MSNNIPGPEGFFFNRNKDKNKDQHPDMKGNIKLSPAQLEGLVQIYRAAQAEGREPVLQIDLAGWTRVSKNDGQKYLYLKTDVYTGPRKSQSRQSAPQRQTYDNGSDLDDDIPF